MEILGRLAIPTNARELLRVLRHCDTTLTVMTIMIGSAGGITTAALYHGQGAALQLGPDQGGHSCHGAWAQAQDPCTFWGGGKTRQVPHYAQFDLHLVPHCPSFASFLALFSCHF